MSLSPEKAYGPLVLGSLFASFLSGLTTFQALVYLRFFNQDPKSLKAMVVSVWLLDLVHTAFTWEGVWFYLVQSFGDESKILIINYCIVGGGIVTGVVTFITHCFYVYRIFRLSNRKYLLAVPILFVAFARFTAAFVATSILQKVKTFPNVLEHFSWVVTNSLSLTCAADILITLSMFVLLRMNRNKSTTLNHVLDRLVLYTFEMGTLTGCAAILAMLCWIFIPNKLVFLGLYFPIGKLYANSLLASLNARHQLRKMREKGARQTYGSSRDSTLPQIGSKDTTKSKDISFKREISLRYDVHPLEVNVEHKVDYDGQVTSPSSPKC